MGVTELRQNWRAYGGMKDVAGSFTPIGAHDQAINADATKATYLVWYRDATTEVMENAGHYPMHGTPVALALASERFLRG